MRKLFYLVPISMLLFSCNKDEITDCMQEKIDEWDVQNDCEIGVHVDKYIFQDEQVFVFDPGGCGADMQSPVYDRKCNSLGALGGITGNWSINGEDFSNAEFVEVVWTKP